MLSTSTDDRRLLITLGIQLCVQRVGRLGVRQRRAVYRRQLIFLSLMLVTNAGGSRCVGMVTIIPFLTLGVCLLARLCVCVSEIWKTNKVQSWG